tara:strand:- start:20 stop:277 length:258 start_codon:yes stop_codon:yes gene_type:complete
MDELMDMIAADDSASQVSDKIKDILYSKSAERVDGYKPNVANSLFGDQESADEVDADVKAAAAVIAGQPAAETEVEDEVEDESEE